MRATRFIILPRFVFMLLALILSFATPRFLWAQANLENPASGSFQSGIGVISGWKCTANAITVSFDDGPEIQVAYGTSRADTQSVCGKANTGFGLLLNWNLLGDGPHTVSAKADGVEFASATFTVTTLGQEFLTGASGSSLLSNFPQAGKNVTVQWQESLQNFAITRLGSASTSLLPGLSADVTSQDAALENPQPGSFQSGIGIISGWVCNANRVDIVFDGTATLQAAYGTSRADTQAVCGKENTGFGLLFNWNLLGDGTHTVSAKADGVEFGNATFTVTTLGQEFLQGASGAYQLLDFPRTGKNITLRWQESLQNLVITSWPNSCGDGRIDFLIDDFEDPSLWSYCCGDRDLPSVTLTQAAGCTGASGDHSLALDYDLRGGDWFIILRHFSPEPLDLREFTHLRIALQGSNLNAHHDLQLKLVNTVGTQEYIYWVVAKSTADLPAWRPIYVDLHEFTCFGDENTTCKNPPPLDLSAITRVEVGISRCRNQDGTECEPGSDEAVVSLDELAAVDLRPGTKNRLTQTQFEQVAPDPDLRASTAKAIRDHQDQNNALVPAFFQESSPNYNTFSQALALLVFVEEYERTKEPAYKEAANRLASKLLTLQIPDGKVNTGAWYTSYALDDEGQVIPLHSDPPCTGDEKLTSDGDDKDINRCSWIGNTAWAVIVLARLKNSGIYNNPAELDVSVAKATSWMVAQIGRSPKYPDLVTEGLEGNISTYFGLLAADKGSEAQRVGNSTYENGWDAKEQRLKIGAGPSSYATAMDTAGSWGAEFLRCIGKKEDALSSQAYAATVLRTNSFDTLVNGYGDIAGPWTMTVEFGAQGAAAGILDSDYVMKQIYPLQKPDGSFPNSTDNWFGGTVPAFTTTMTGVGPTAWVYFAQNGDPLLALCPGEH
ncbi:MAG TPA: hypothetical protein VGX03_11420 [Candidatus Binatia bacterium]|nr:hypothetical protein [Candidatus Binatia bacterium]